MRKLPRIQGVGAVLLAQRCADLRNVAQICATHATCTRLRSEPSVYSLTELRGSIGALAGDETCRSEDGGRRMAAEITTRSPGGMRASPTRPSGHRAPA